MAMNIIQKILGSANDRLVRSYDKTVSIINDLEPKYHAMSDDELRAQTDILQVFHSSFVLITNYSLPLHQNSNASC